MEEQLISFETAKLAREKGFNIFNGKAWIKKEGQELFFTPVYTGITNGIDYHAPTQAQLQKWLRKVHNLHVIYIPTEKHKFEKIEYSFFIMSSIGYIHKTGENFNTPEEALETGLQEALKLLS